MTTPTVNQMLKDFNRRMALHRANQASRQASPTGPTEGDFELSPAGSKATGTAIEGTFELNPAK